MNRKRRDFKDKSSQDPDSSEVDNWPFIIVIVVMVIGALAAINYFGAKDLTIPLTIIGVVIVIALFVILPHRPGDKQSPLIDIVANLFNLGSDK